MHRRVAVCSGIFLLMALSNAVVPVLDIFAEGPAAQGLVFSAYFFGAMLTVLPAGIASERFGRARLMQAGLGISLGGGLAIALAPSVPVLIAARLVEGVATGVFVSAALAYVNSQPDGGRGSGAFMASLNAGLFLGLIVTGVLVEQTGLRSAGVIAFSCLTAIPLILAFTLKNGPSTVQTAPLARLGPVLSQYRWILYATVIMFGAGGAVTGLYPEFSTVDPGLLGLQIALQNITTIVAVIVVSRLALEPIPLIKGSACLMALAVGVSFLSPYGFVLIGAAAGAVQIAALVFFAQTQEPQGVAVGLFNTASYAGMTVLPALAGACARWFGYPVAFGLVVLFAISVALTIQRCSRCRLPRSMIPRRG